MEGLSLVVGLIVIVLGIALISAPFRLYSIDKTLKQIKELLESK